ncbi:MAG: hypothetical protein KC731_42360 [Myxococcales bacterium]|nr:hypothetical protein [Myxococcales bacterium]
MSMEAVAVLQIPYPRVVVMLGQERDAGEGTWVKTQAGPRKLEELEGGCLFYLGVPVGEVSPSELGLLLRGLLGDLVDRHDDERGVFVFPARARGDAKAVAALVDDVGDLGEWVEVPDALPAELAGGMGGEGMEAMLGQVASMMGAEPGQMAGLWEQAQEMMGDPAMQSQLMAAAQQLMGQMGGQGGGLDLGALAAEAQKVLASDPELAARMKDGLGGGKDGDDGDG